MIVSNSAADLSVVLRRYGFIGVDRDGAPRSLIVADRSDHTLPGLVQVHEPAGGFLFEPRQWRFVPRRRTYRALLDHVSYSGPGLTPIWVSAAGRTVIGWWDHDGRRSLLVGLNLVDELVRYTQGDPAKVITAKDKTLWGVGHERPAYLFEDNIVPGAELVPWADRLGLLVARALSGATGLPLLAPLPGGARGAILLTGDDDQAELAKYDFQRRLLDGFPITYLMLPHTKHTPETLAAMPASVEYGVHIDALDRPGDYDAICAQQTDAVRRLVRRPARTVRNHGHLNRGYWTQLSAWEQNGLTLDFQIRGLDGTCPTGSYLPFRVRRPDGSWSDHWSLFSTFSDSMLFMQKWSQAKQVNCITAVARSFNASSPGVIVANFHPQNADQIPKVHKAVMRLGRQPGWVALGGDSYSQWIQAIDGICLSDDGGLKLTSNAPIEGLVLQWPDQPSPVTLPPWSGTLDLGSSIAHAK